MKHQMRPHVRPQWIAALGLVALMTLLLPTGKVFMGIRATGATERVSVASDGTEGNDESGTWALAMSGNGRYVAFESNASNLVDNDTNNRRDVFAHNLQTDQTVRVSIAPDGTQGNDSSGEDNDSIAISADGRYVAFRSVATNLIAGDTNGDMDIFVHDRDVDGDDIYDETGQVNTVRVSVASDSTQADGFSYTPSMSSDGRYVAFCSLANNLVYSDTNDAYDVFVHDWDADGDGIFDEAGQVNTTRASVASDGTQANDDSCWGVSISADGRYVAFESEANNLVSGDTNACYGYPDGHCSDVFVHDLQTGQTVLVSIASDGTQIVAWRDSRAGDSIGDIYMATSTDHSKSWSANRRVDHAASGYFADYPAVAVSNAGQVYIMWHDGRNDDRDIYLTSVAKP